MGYGIVNTLDDGGYVTRTVALHHGDRHDPCIRVHTCSTDTIATYGSSDSCTVGAMTVVVADAWTVVHEVPTVDVILESVGIVISAFCTFILKLVCPDIGCKVWVCDVNTSIEDGDDRTLVCYL